MTEANEHDANEQEQKRLTLRSGGTLGLRRPVETGQVRQSFSHGRSKAVTVEVRKKRAVPPGTPEPGRGDASPAPAARAHPASSAPSGRSARPAGRTLTAEEHATRVRVLQDARKADEETRRRDAVMEGGRRREQDQRSEEEARQRTEDDARRRVEEEDARKRGEEDARKRAEDEEARRREEESRREVAERAGKAAAAKVAALAAAGKVTMPAEEEEEAAAARPGRR